jgi:allantoinase
MVHDGSIDTIGSDHSPAPPELKHLDDGNLRLAWGGIASLQLLLPVTWTASQWGQCWWSHRTWIPQLTSHPAALVGLSARKGAIAPGHDADLVVFDHETAWGVEQDRLFHRHKATPFDGRELCGIVETTYLRGRKVYDVYDRGRILGEPRGQLLRRPGP